MPFRRCDPAGKLISATRLSVHFVGLSVERFGEVAKLPLGRCVSGAIGNIATFIGAFAECVRV
jgi:hypothetical protein